MLRELKYISAYLIPLQVIIALLFPENFSFLPIIFSFVLLPVAELLMVPDLKNLPVNDEPSILSKKLYDYLLYFCVPVQWFVIFLFLHQVVSVEHTTLQLIGMVASTGLCSAVLGINVAHELGHRTNKTERLLAKMLLLSSLYMHFYVEHNRGHHKHVSTVHDPASAAMGTGVYVFLWKTLTGSYMSAWKIQLELLNKEHASFFSFGNQMLVFQFIQLAFLAGIFSVAGGFALLMFLATAFFGIIVLEIINYIEHYGLRRKEISHGVYESVKLKHSWNSSHQLGRIMLFELTRHADHHYKASRKYQVLKHWDQSPQLPTGYPGMMLLSLIPPLWFYVMNKRVEEANGTPDSALSA